MGWVFLCVCFSLLFAWTDRRIARQHVLLLVVVIILVLLVWLLYVFGVCVVCVCLFARRRAAIEHLYRTSTTPFIAQDSKIDRPGRKAVACLRRLQPELCLDLPVGQTTHTHTANLSTVWRDFLLSTAVEIRVGCTYISSPPDMMHVCQL